MSWSAKVNRHVTLLKVGGGTVKAKPGVITGFADAPDGNPIIRVGRHDTNPGLANVQLETYGDSTTGVPRRTDPDENLAATKYISY